MPIRALIFDVNGTLTHIRTDESADEPYRTVGHFLVYQGIRVNRRVVRELYFTVMAEQRAASPEPYPEFDAERVWGEVLERLATDYTHALPAAKRAWLPQVLAELYRGATRHKLKLYPGVRETLDVLRTQFPLAAVTDAQRAYARAELHAVGLLEYFRPLVVSGDHGYRKPDPRLFRHALDALGVAAHEAVYVGNDMYRDVHGARQLGMHTVFVASGQGRQSHGDLRADFTAHRFEELLDAVRTLQRR